MNTQAMLVNEMHYLVKIDHYYLNYYNINLKNSLPISYDFINQTN